MVVETRVDFDDEASSHSTLLQVVAQDIPGLLRAVSLALAGRGCNIEVALVDTEGETAIDVFYVTRNGAKLDAAEEKALKTRPAGGDGGECAWVVGARRFGEERQGLKGGRECKRWQPASCLDASDMQ